MVKDGFKILKKAVFYFLRSDLLNEKPSNQYLIETILL